MNDFEKSFAAFFCTPAEERQTRSVSLVCVPVQSQHLQELHCTLLGLRKNPELQGKYIKG